MKDPEFQLWVERIQRRPLSPEEMESLRQRAGSDPVVGEFWETEVGLTRRLHELPDAPVASNFTARVLQAVESARPTRLGWREALGRRLWMRPACYGAGAALVFLLGVWAYLDHQSTSRARMAASLVRITRGVDAAAGAAQLPPLQVLQDFEAIRQLSRAQPLADESLLAALR
jgi:hypothetical protein